MKNYYLLPPVLAFITLLTASALFNGCAGMNFGYKDPEAGVDVTCVTKEEVTKCSYIGPDGKEVFVDAPVIGQDAKPIPEPSTPK